MTNRKENSTYNKVVRKCRTQSDEVSRVNCTRYRIFLEPCDSAIGILRRLLNPHLWNPCLLSRLWCIGGHNPLSSPLPQVTPTYTTTLPKSMWGESAWASHNESFCLWLFGFKEKGQHHQQRSKAQHRGFMAGRRLGKWRVQLDAVRAIPRTFTHTGSSWNVGRRDQGKIRLDLNLRNQLSKQVPDPSEIASSLLPPQVSTEGLETETKKTER